MSKQTVIQDVCDVIITDITTGKVAANTYMQMSGLEGTIDEEDLRAGIGNGKIFKIRSNKDLNLNFTSAVFDKDWLAMTQGVQVKKVGIEDVIQTVITRAETLTLGENMEITLPETDLHAGEEVLEGSYTVSGSLKVVKDLTAVEGVITATDAGLAGEDVTVSYQVAIAGDKVEFDSAKFSTKYKVELRTIAYDLETAEVYSDIYFIFPEAIPGGEFNLSFEAGNVISPELTFSIVQPKGTTLLGEMVEVPRPVTP